MSDIEIGELYLVVKQYFWFVFPTKEVGMKAAMTAAWSSSMAYQNARLLSQRYNSNVAVVEENTYFMLLEQDEKFFKVLDSNGNIGWIRCDDFSKYFELVKAKQ